MYCIYVYNISNKEFPNLRIDNNKTKRIDSYTCHYSIIPRLGYNNKDNPPSIRLKITNSFRNFQSNNNIDLILTPICILCGRELYFVAVHGMSICINKFSCLLLACFYTSTGPTEDGKPQHVC